MKSLNTLSVTAILSAVVVLSPSCGKKPVSTGYPAEPVSLEKVDFLAGFWGQRLETNRTVTIPYAFRMCEETGRVKNFEIASGEEEGRFCSKYPFDDSDVFKIIEGASYSMMQNPDPALEADLDALIAKIAAAQEKDGYLYTARTIGGPPPVDWVGEERWSHLYLSHELYNLGTLFEAGVAHFQATGKKTLLKPALKAADLIVREFGPGKRMDVPGHQEVEIGLVKLYRLTGKREYLDLAKFFLDQRGNAEGHKLYGEYSQDHKPVVEQDEAVGHAVRAVYMYAAMADAAALTGDKAYIPALEKIWESVVGRKMYLTGGIGAAGAWEGFGPDYVLPNDVAYAETCAAIANAFWNHRLFLLHEDGKYIDVLERVLYNGVLPGVSMSGDTFFYPNPLASSGKHERSAWFNCACCPSNIPRFLPQVASYVYAVSGGGVYVNLYIQGTGTLETNGTRVDLRQETAYPWQGNIILHVDPEKPVEFPLLVRIPGWALGRPVPTDLYRYLEESEEKPRITVNGEEIPLKIERGYAAVSREWKKGDRVEVVLPMPVRRVLAHDAVEADRGRVAVERGPLVYCAEWPDNDGSVRHLILEDAEPLSAKFHPNFLGGVTLVTAKAVGLRQAKGKIQKDETVLTLIPYYSWAHRGKGEMEVWLAREAEKASPLLEAGLSSIPK